MITYPELSLYNHQEVVSIQVSRLANQKQAIVECLSWIPSGPGDPLLFSFSEVEVSFLDDDEIAAQHDQFLDDPTATDVITFLHGELLISAETAQREAAERKTPLERELMLYLIHGLLHLHGYLDGTETDRTVMTRVQEGLLEDIWPLFGE
ncbi:MAG: rRNA maturation RNase YbeY [Verrucomicrobiota bacterium]